MALNALFELSHRKRAKISDMLQENGFLLYIAVVFCGLSLIHFISRIKPYYNSFITPA